MPTSFLASGKTDEAFTPEQAIIGATDVITVPGTLVSGQNLAAGSVLGRITTGGKYTLCDSGAEDGSEVPVAILVDAVNAASADKACVVYTAGEFNVDWLTFHASFSTAALKLNAFGNAAPIVLKKLAYSAV